MFAGRRKEREEIKAKKEKNEELVNKNKKKG